MSLEKIFKKITVINTKEDSLHRSIWVVKERLCQSLDFHVLTRRPLNLILSRIVRRRAVLGVNWGHSSPQKVAKKDFLTFAQNF